MLFDTVAHIPYSAMPHHYYQEVSGSPKKQLAQVELAVSKPKAEESHEARMVRELQSQLAYVLEINLRKLQIKCANLESKNFDLTTQVSDLRRLVRRVADESEEHLIKAEKKCKKQQQELNRANEAKQCLEKDGVFLHSVASFWEEHVEKAAN